MKTSLVYLFVLTLVAAVGCSPSATPETKQPAEPVKTVVKRPIAEPVKTFVEKPIAGEADETFSLSVPFESVAITQGKEKSVLIGINRGHNFREEVAIEVSDLPRGVTLVTADPVIKQGATDVTLMLKAASDAALGDFTIKLTGQTASSSADFTKEFKMTVAEK